MNALRNRLSSMATRIIDKFSGDSLLKFYKGMHSRDEEFASIEVTFSKQTYTESLLALLLILIQVSLL